MFFLIMCIRLSQNRSLRVRRRIRNDMCIRLMIRTRHRISLHSRTSLSVCDLVLGSVLFVI